MPSKHINVEHVKYHDFILNVFMTSFVLLNTGFLSFDCAYEVCRHFDSSKICEAFNIEAILLDDFCVTLLTYSVQS